MNTLTCLSTSSGPDLSSNSALILISHTPMTASCRHRCFSYQWPVCRSYVQHKLFYSPFSISHFIVSIYSIYIVEVSFYILNFPFKCTFFFFLKFTDDPVISHPVIKYDSFNLIFFFYYLDVLILNGKYLSCCKCSVNDELPIARNAEISSQCLNSQSLN